MITNEEKFNNMVETAKSKFLDYEKFKDVPSIRDASFACGQVVGFYRANGSPKEWGNAVVELEERFCELTLPSKT